MCGICGFFEQTQTADQQILKLMNDQIIHRGPDDEGFYYQNKVGLAVRRLSIIDLVTGHQPLASNSGLHWIAYNGEVYNFSELRADLIARGYQFKTKTDTEVIVNMYQEYGEDFVKHLRGMFAIAIVDKKKNRLVLARDHVGIKPLYYTLNEQSKNLIFASEIKSILKYPGINREIDPVALDYFLTLEYIPAPHSIFKQIKKLPAGHLLIFENGLLSIKQYWDVQPGQADDNFNQLIGKFHELLSQSVQMRMIADVPLGGFLSGGIDSSTIVAVMKKLSAQPIKTFSIGFTDKSYSELHYSDLVAGLLHTDHHKQILNPDIDQLVRYLANYFDEPLADFSNFPTYLVSKMAREKVTVALSGDGGDEIFGGYEHYLAQQLASRFIDHPLCKPWHSWLSKTSRLFPPSKIKKGMINRIKRFSEGLVHAPVNRHFRWMFFLNQLQKQHLYHPEFLSEEFFLPLPERSPFSVHFKQAKQFPGLNQDLYLDFKTYLVDNILVKVDRTSMATSLEARVPLLDYKLAEFAFSLPPDYKVRGRTGKWFFKKAMAGILPDSIIYRQKEGFSIPIKNWLRTDLKALMMHYLSEENLNHSGFFNPEYVRALMTEHLENKQDHAHRLWSLITFFMWKEKFFN